MNDEIYPLPITGELDLHTFRPREVGSLVPEYLAECQARGILTVRIVHGRGTGALRQTVHALLARHPEVVAFTLAGEQMGGWGATVVRLRSLSTAADVPSPQRHFGSAPPLEITREAWKSATDPLCHALPRSADLRPGAQAARAGPEAGAPGRGKFGGLLTRRYAESYL